MSIASPLAAGGAGPDFEVDVRVHYLGAVLAASPPRGAAAGIATEVEFQRKPAGAPLDDLVIRSSTPRDEFRTDLQVKHRFTFAPSDPQMEPVLRACWETFNSDGFRVPGNRFGVAIGRFPERVRTHYVRVPEFARASASAEEFFTRIARPVQASEEMRRFVRDVQAHLAGFAGPELDLTTSWDFFRRLVILDFDFGIEGSRDRLHTLESLRWLVQGNDVTAAGALFADLAEIAKEGGHTGGTYSAETLRELLLDHALEPSPPVREDVARIADRSRGSLEEISDSIGPVVLDRTVAVDEIVQRTMGGGLLVLTGDPGAGKSALLKAAVAVRAQEGPVFALSPIRLEGIVGWEGLAERWQLGAPVDSLARAMSAYARPTLAVDGADRIESPGARAAVNDLLRAIGRVLPRPDGKPSWTILLAARKEGLAAVREWLTMPFTAADVLQVPGLNDDEAGKLALELPHLAPVLASPHVSPVVRNPYFLSIFERARGQDPDHDPQVATEGDVHRLWWERVVGRGGAEGLARRETMLGFGRRAMVSRSPRLQLAEGADARVVHGLVEDRVLIRDAQTDSYHFAHDIVEEWTLARVLGQHDHELRAYLASVGDPYWAYAAVQFLACLRLEDPGGRDHWTEMLRTVGASPAEPGRWGEAVLTGPFRSARIRRLLDDIGPVLLAEEGAWLSSFLRAVRTIAITPDPQVQALTSAGGSDPSEAAALALQLGIPNWLVWLPVMIWLVPQLRELSSPARFEASHIMTVWQRRTAPGDPFRREIAEVAQEWWGTRLDGRDDRPVAAWGQAQEYLDQLRDSVVRAADAVPERIPGFLDAVLHSSRGHRVEEWLAWPPQPVMARFTPGAYADFALDVLVPGWRPGSDPESAQREPDDGTFRPASHLQGPFLLLLRESEADGLRLVNTLVNAAHDEWRRTRQSWGGDITQAVIIHFPHGDRTYLGDIQVYAWMRPDGNAKSTVTSALMALEVWMEEQVEAGRDPAELFRAVLADSQTVATVAVCISMCLAFPERCFEASAPFLMTATLYPWDVARYTRDLLVKTFNTDWWSGRPDLARANERRNQRPQRFRDIRSLVLAYVHSSNEQLREPVLRAIRAFPEDLSPLSEDERASEDVVRSYREDMRIYAALADPANYHVVDGGNYLEIRYVPPAEVLASRASEQEFYARFQRVTALADWARRSRVSGIAEGGRTLAEAVAEARSISRPDDFYGPRGGEIEYLRLEAVASVAAVGIRLDPVWLQAEGHLEWCRQILVAAAGPPVDQTESDANIPTEEAMLWSAVGLLGLARHGLIRAEERRSVITLAGRSNRRVESAILEGMREAWDADPVLTRNFVAREFVLAVAPRTTVLLDEETGTLRRVPLRADDTALVAELEANLIEGTLPADIAMRVPTAADRFHTRHAERALRSIPLGVVVPRPGERQWVLGATISAFHWTVDELQAEGSREPHNRGSPESTPPGWIDFMGEWLQQCAAALPADTFDEIFLTPLESSWPASAALTAELMDAVVSREFARGPVAVTTRAHWERISGWVIPEQRPANRPWRWYDRGVVDAILLVVFVRYGQSPLPVDWPEAATFVPIVERWVDRVGHLEDPFRALLTFLQGPGRHLDPTRIVRWLSEAVTHMPDSAAVFQERGTGTVTARVLSQAWQRGSVSIHADLSLAASYAALLDRLVAAGEPLAVSLREELH